MKPTQQLHDLGQSLWLDNITRGLLKDGTLRRYIEELSITGLTSNPSIFDHAIKESNFYDDAIHQKMKEGKSGEALFFELAIEDLRQAALGRGVDMFGALPPIRTQHPDLRSGAKRVPQQSVGMQLQQPLALLHVALAPRQIQIGRASCRERV